MEKYYNQLPPLSKYDEEDTTIQSVQIDGLVVIKIMKHCKEHFPELVTGQLLGLDAGNVLEITHSFPFLEEGTEDERSQYQMQMMHCLRQVNIDSNAVGWYSTTYMGSLVDEVTVKSLFNYQEKLKKCVTLFYDHVKTSQGNLSLKAYRLSHKFITLYKNQSFTKESIGKTNFSFTDIFEEFPLSITNAPLVNAYLFELQESGNTNLNFKELDLAKTSYLERSIELLSDGFDSLAQQQNSFAMYQRNLAKQQVFLQKRRAENVARRQLGQDELPEDELIKPEPSRLEYLLVSNQIDAYCKQVDRFAANNLAKLFLQTSVWKN